MYPYAPDVHSFLHCAHGVAVVKRCPGELVWDDVAKLCNWRADYLPGRAAFVDTSVDLEGKPCCGDE